MTLTQLVELPAGSFSMGSTEFYPEETPVRTVSVRGFAIDRHPVTNAQFAEFVSTTGYVTIAEQKLDPMLYPGIRPDDLIPGGLVFRPTSGPSTSATGGNGGNGYRMRTGAVRSGPTPTSPVRLTTRWCRSPTPTLRSTLAGLVGGCRPRRGGNTQRVPARRLPIRGVTRPRREGSWWRIPGRADSHTVTMAPKAGLGHRL